ncbi:MULTISPECIES: hypothetical protein [unclassified Streptomyces]|nr:hypothetical protein OG282_31295 [Streptomyces sp. NBC_01014]WSX71407.1 hypothetical protein OG221_35035 [Streptomyces sp. NBC_00932]
MSQWTMTLRPGLPIVCDGEKLTAAEIEGRRILLRQSAVRGPPKLRQVEQVEHLGTARPSFNREPDAGSRQDDRIRCPAERPGG